MGHIFKFLNYKIVSENYVFILVKDFKKVFYFVFYKRNFSFL